MRSYRPLAKEQRYQIAVLMQVNRKQKEIAELQRQIEEKATQYRLDCSDVLTPEQQSKSSAFGPGMGRGHGPGWNHGGRW